MGEKELVDRTPEPRTRRSLAADLRRLGLGAGAVVIVHSPLSSLGWVCGGPVAVVQALTDAVTGSGTLVMPTHSADYSDPAGWQNPPVPKGWQEAIRENMPAFDPRTASTLGVGRVPETFRSRPGVSRSSHPAVSFAAWGRHAGFVTGGHSLDHSLGEGSPLARIYDLDGQVLLLGAGHGSNTSFHLAEYRAPGARRVAAGAPILEGGRKVWKTYGDIELDEGAFAGIGAEFERAVGVRSSRVASAEKPSHQRRNAGAERGPAVRGDREPRESLPPGVFFDGARTARRCVSVARLGTAAGIRPPSTPACRPRSAPVPGPTVPLVGDMGYPRTIGERGARRWH